jgi:hypothetical protein
MSIIDFDNNIHKDTNVYGDNVYIGNGQGCSTIWFPSVSIAKKAFQKDGIMRGYLLADCTKCQCHYSYSSKEYHKFEPHVCREAKEEYVKKFM